MSRHRQDRSFAMMVFPSDVSLFFQRKEQDENRIRHVVTIPTFRRPEHLLKTLESVVSQRLEHPFSIIVMENDAGGLAGAEAARTFFETRPIDAAIVIAHQRGNCHAYNAGWAAAPTLYPGLEAIAVIDDDEIAAPGWLERLVSTQKNTQAAFVGGPQRPLFEEAGLEKWASHPVFTPHYDTTGPVPVLFSSGNVLVTRPVLEKMPFPYLDPAFNFIGGGDSDLYRRSRINGFFFAWCAEAVVDETVPARRTERSWISARSRRNGAISAFIEHRENPGWAARIKTVLKSFALLGVSPLRGVPLWRKTGLVSAGFYHFHVAIGRLMAELGLVNEQYRNPEKN